jgi:hypothetical protein
MAFTSYRDKFHAAQPPSDRPPVRHGLNAKENFEARMHALNVRYERDAAQLRAVFVAESAERRS